jgi:hypothetical protein
VSTQRRAGPGGETGANGEWYEGGKFIATQDNPKRSGRSKKGTRKVGIEPWKWEIPPEEGMRPIYGRMGAGVFTGIRMTTLLLTRRITARTWRMSMRRKQVAVSLANGAMVFCDQHVESAFFCGDA